VIEPGGERVELRLPIFAVAVEPERGLEDRPGFKPAAADPAGALLRDETGPDENLDVARHRLQGNVEGRGQFRDEQIFAVEPVQHRPPHRIGERRENAVEHRLLCRTLRRNYVLRHNHAIGTILNSFVDSQHISRPIVEPGLAPSTVVPAKAGTHSSTASTG